jgi:hypothetical protein
MLTKEEQCEHIEKKMHIVDMHKTRSNKPPILFLVFDFVWIQYPFLINLRSVPGIETGGDGYY